jgi:prepilin-type processing-associated H-X9-DG protein
MNGVVNGSLITVPPSGFHYPVGRTYYGQGITPRLIKTTQLQRPVDTFVAVDEHPDSINDSIFMFNAGQLPPNYSWRDLPASYHNGAAGFSFADGHSEIHKWQSQATKRPVTRQNFTGLADPDSPDIAWMNEKMPWF